MNTNPFAKRILCFGDSITWGYVPGSNYDRWPANVRWTGVLQGELGKDFEIIEEGLNSRTLTSEDMRPGKGGRSGKQYLLPCLDSHDPLDLVVLFLGTSELKDKFQMTALDIGNILEKEFIETILYHPSQSGRTQSKLLLISPPIINPDIPYAHQRYAECLEKNKALAGVYKALADRHGCGYLDAAQVVSVGDDGVHLSAEANKVLGAALAKRVLELLNS